jgi:hypothetical protein
MMTMRATGLTAALLAATLMPAAAFAQVVMPASAPSRPPGSRLWIVAGGGFSVARAGCAACDRDGVFTNSKSLLLDAGVRMNPKVDVGVELFILSSKIESDEPIRTTFILALAQIRPWDQRGFFMRAGMGLGFAGNGIFNPIGPPLAPPFTTNALGVTYGAGWILTPNRRYGVQINATHHVAAIGELTTVEGTSVLNVVGNYWTIGAAIVFR